MAIGERSVSAAYRSVGRIVSGEDAAGTGADAGCVCGDSMARELSAAWLFALSTSFFLPRPAALMARNLCFCQKHTSYVRVAPAGPQAVAQAYLVREPKFWTLVGVRFIITPCSPEAQPLVSATASQLLCVRPGGNVPTAFAMGFAVRQVYSFTFERVLVAGAVFERPCTLSQLPEFL